MATKNAWHMMDTEQIAARLESHVARGLSRKQAHSRAKKLNIRQPDARHPLFLPARRPMYQYVGKMLLDPIMILTLLVALIIFFFGQYALGGMIVFIMLCNAVCCAVAYAKAEDVWQTMQLYSNPMVKVIRGGKLYTTDARNVVPGDLVLLTQGDVCPADIRLEEGNAVRVTQYQPDTSGDSLFVRETVQKNGNRIYLPDEDVQSPYCENIVYAGSVIEHGFARGIAVETGKNTFIGAANGTVPGTDHTREPDSTGFIRRYFVRFSTFQAVLLIPLTMIMTVTLRSQLSFAECFLTALVLCCTAIAEHIVALTGIVRATGIDLAASQKENASVAIIKNSLAPDCLCEMTDLLLFDSAAISDGKYHLESVYAGGNIYSTTELIDPSVYKLCYDLYLYRSATRPVDSLEKDQFDAGFGSPMDALIKHLEVDTAAIDLTKTSSYITYEPELCTVHCKLNQGEYDVLLTQNEDILQKCAYMLSSDEQKPFDSSEHIALRTLCRIYRESGYRILIVAHRKQESVTLMGVLAFAHRPGYQFNECCTELIESGVRVSVFMPYTMQSMKILTDCGFIRDENNDVLTAQRADQEGLDLYVAYGSYRAYLGFTQSQIADLIERLHQRGSKIASYCVDHNAQPLHEMADLKITCDSLEYRSAKVAEALYDKMPIDGKPFSSRASQNTRRSSDMILRRADERGGGLHGILTGRKYAFAINHNLANMMTYLITVQFFRILLLAVPAMFGTFTLSAVSLLICGLVIDAIAVILFAFATPNRGAITASYPIMRRLEKPIAYNTANIVSATVSALLLWLGIAMLQIFGVIGQAEVTGLSFVSTYLLQGVVFVITLMEYAAKKEKKKASPALLSVLGGFLLMLAVCIFLPGLNTLIGTAGMAFTTLLMTPFASLVYFLMYKVLSAKGLNLHK